MTNMGALPVSFDIEADNLADAVANYGDAARLHRAHDEAAGASPPAVVRAHRASGRRRPLLTSGPGMGGMPGGGRSSCRSVSHFRLAVLQPPFRRACLTAQCAGDQHRDPRRLRDPSSRVRDRALRASLPGASVVLLIVVGLIARQVLEALGLHFHQWAAGRAVARHAGPHPDRARGALDLKVTRDAILIVTAAASSLLGFLASLGAFGLIFYYLLGFRVPQCWWRFRSP
jgi:hypothetical protein